MKSILVDIIIAVILFYLCYLVYDFTMKKNTGRRERAGDLRSYNKNARFLIRGLFTFIYLCLFAYIMILIRIIDNEDLVVYFLLLLLSAGGIIGMLIFAFVYRNSLNKKMLFLFLGFVAVVLYITIISRQGSVETTVKMEVFSSLKEAWETKSLTLLSHFAMNTAMFLPLGFFFAGIREESTDKLKSVVLFGISFSTIIESVQLVFQWGECDIDDIIANVLGAVLGWLLLKVFYKTEILNRR